MKTSATELRSVIDGITLAVADKAEGDLETRIADEATLYIDQLRREQKMLTDHDIDRIASAIVRGVLKRLLQIAYSGGLSAALNGNCRKKEAAPKDKRGYV